MLKVFTTMLIATAVLSVTTTADANSFVPRESNLISTLDSAYGGDFVVSGDTFTNGSITGVQVDLTIFTAGIYETRALARFAGFQQALGYRYDATSDVNHIFTYTDVGTAGSFTADRSFELVRYDPVTGGRIMSSNSASNELGNIQMLAYELTGTGITDPTYVVFFEDLINGDNDFNDLIAEVKIMDYVSSAPSPGAGLGGIALLSLMMGRRMLKRRRVA